MQNYTVTELENRLMKAIIKSLIELGGIASRKEIKRDIYDNSTLIAEDYMDYTRISENSGRTYKPFDYQFNFAMKHLLLAGYVKYIKRTQVEMTEKARQVDVNHFDPQQAVRPISEPLFAEQAKKKQMSEDGLIQNKSNIHEEDNITEEEDISDSWRNTLKESLKKMPPYKFEMFARGLMNRMGIDLDKTTGIQPVADGGVDGFGFITSDDFRTTRVALQAKRWVGKVSAPEIDKFRGAMDKFNAEYGIFITTSDYTREAVKAAREGTRVITLINGDDICDLVAKYEYYVTPVTTYELQDFYFEKE